MKIYTEINYKWLDGQLVKTDSKSFEYDGEVILCGPGGGGGGTLAKVADKVISPAGNVVSDVAGLGSTAADIGTSVLEEGVGAAGNLGDTASTAIGENLTDLNTITSGLGDGVNQLADNTIGKAGDVISEGIDSGGAALGEGLAMNSGVATTLSNAGDALSTNLQPIKSNLDKAGTMVTDNIKGATDFIGEKANELTTFFHGSTPPSQVDVAKGAVKGSLKGKQKSEFGANKGKKRARKSLRIGK